MLGLIEVFFFLFSGYEHNFPRSLGSLKGKSLIRRCFFFNFIKLYGIFS